MARCQEKDAFHFPIVRFDGEVVNYILCPSLLQEVTDRIISFMEIESFDAINEQKKEN